MEQQSRSVVSLLQPPLPTQALFVEPAEHNDQNYIHTINISLYVRSTSLSTTRQSVQNAAARLVTGAQRRDHITPILRQLHWLPVRQRVTFKIAVLVFQCLTGQAPAYLADDCQLTSYVSTRRLRSTDTAMCVVRRSSNSFGDRCLRLLDHACGTRCQSIYGSATVSDSLNGC